MIKYLEAEKIIFTMHHILSCGKEICRNQHKAFKAAKIIQQTWKKYTNKKHQKRMDIIT